uniref:Uncharacterized protein n=1 Tax=Chuzhou Botou tick virus 1 TaxID=2972077 RepID=A0A9E7V221_9VIRU|nr:MAG: hypothetical protein [Chuzhou Botou tick virus 1]
MCSRKFLRTRWHQATITRRENLRGSAAEQEIVRSDRKHSPSRYWHARRISRCQSKIREAIEKSMSRVSIGERDQLMVKIDLASGESANETPGIKHIRKNVKNLLHKREVYASYFERNLPSVDSALRRVQAFRAWGVERVLLESDREVETASPGVFELAPGRWQYRTVLKDKISLKECGRKEKQKLKEYATRVRDRRVAQASHRNDRLAASQARRAERERRRAVEQEDRNAIRLRLLAQARVSVENPRSVLVGCSSHRVKECDTCWDSRQIVAAKKALESGIRFLPFLEEIKARDALIDELVKEWQGSPPA